MRKFDDTKVIVRRRRRRREGQKVQYSQRHSVINHCDITLLSHTDTVQSET